MSFEEYKKQLKFFLSGKLYIGVVSILILIGYGYATFNMSVGVDDLESYRYFGRNVMLHAGRYGMIFWDYLFIPYGSVVPAYVAAIDIVALILFFFSNVNICILFKYITGYENKWGYACFAGLWATHPLISEIWEFSKASIYIYGGIFLISLSLIILWNICNKNVSLPKKVCCFVVTSFLLIPVTTSYESIVLVYVFLTLGIIFLDIIFNKTGLKMIIAQELVYAVVLICALVYRFIISLIISIMSGVPYGVGGATTIYWGKTSFEAIINNMRLGFIKDYLLKALFYFPVTEYIIALFLIIFVGLLFGVKKKNIVILLISILMAISTQLLTIIQGIISPYRIMQVASVLIAFTAFCILLAFENNGKVTGAIICVVLFLCLRQALYLNYQLTLNNLRSEEEKHVICCIGDKLKEMGCTDKKVIFVGNYEYSDNIREAGSISKDSDSWKVYSDLYYKVFGQEPSDKERFRSQGGMNSLIAWGKVAFSDQESMKKIFEFYGYDYKGFADDSLVDDVEAEWEILYGEDYPVYPEVGYIKELNDTVVVALGKIK